MALKFVSKGKSMGETHYDLLIDGEKVGFASSKVTRDATGIHRVRGTTYAACVRSQWFHGSRKVVARNIERLVAVKEGVAQ